MNGLEYKLRQEMVRYLVSKNITCPRTGEVLDFRTCVVLVDRDGDPAYVISQQGWRLVTRSTQAVDTLRGAGLNPDPTTVKDDLCLATRGAYGACVMFPGHGGKHRDANSQQFEVAT
jgi:hypothetical protein